jgi:hypothetical protein
VARRAMTSPKERDDMMPLMETSGMKRGRRDLRIRATPITMSSRARVFVETSMAVKRPLLLPSLLGSFHTQVL